LLIDELAVPGEDRVGLGNRRNLFQGLLTQLLTKLSEDATIAVTELYTTADLLAENAILGCQVRIAEPECFVNRRGDCPQQFLPVHTSLTTAKTSYIDAQYERKRDDIQAEACLMGKA
jgi:hypothetical protein